MQQIPLVIPDKLKTNSELLHFGVDWLTLNIRTKNANKAKSIMFLEELFEIPHNDTNANFIKDFSWLHTVESVDLMFSSSKQAGEMIIVMFQGTPIIRILLPNGESMKNIKYSYQYQINFYGMFFDFHRLNKLNAEYFLKIFLDDIDSGKIEHSISRIDICSDLANFSTGSIQNGIEGDVTHMKKGAKFGIDPSTKEAETITYGNKKSKWMARIYNKLVEAQQKKKEGFYFDYYNYEKVTRLELEIKSDVCQEYKVTLRKTLDKHFIWSLYKKLLNTQFVQWNISSFIESELEKQNFQSVELEKREHTPEALKRFQYFQQTVSRVQNCMDRYHYSDLEMFQALSPHLENRDS